MGDQVGKIMEIPGGKGSNAKPAGTENPVGWAVKLEKPSVGGLWIFSETTQCIKLESQRLHKKRGKTCA